MTAITTSPARTIADRFTTTRARSVAAVVGFALLTAGAAQITFHLPWTPVPITGQTFAVLLTGAALGWRRGAMSQGLYVGLGAIGLPFYADGSGGWAIVTGATAGYLVSYPFAAALIGSLAERRNDRSLIESIPAMLAGSAVIYLFGVVWLAHSLHVGANEAIELGMAPFLIGDAVKALAAAAVLPAAWRLVKER